MKGYQKWLLLTLACALVIGGTVAFLRGGQPRYHGRSLNQWLATYQRGKLNNDGTTQSQALHAVQHIGTNGLPWLLKWLKAERPRWKWGYYWTIDRIDYFAGRSLLYHLLDHLDAKEETDCYRAVTAFEILGSQAALAVPEITRMAEKNPFMAVKALRLIGPEALPGLLALSTNQAIPTFVRDEASHSTREVERALNPGIGAYETGTKTNGQVTQNPALRAIDEIGNDVQGRVNGGCYTVEGRALYDSFGVGRQFLYDFTLTVSNNAWGMEFVAVPPSELRQIQVCDGSNLVAMGYIKKTPGSKAWSDGYMLVDERRTPLCEPEVAHAVFVGFAAQFYLPPGTNGLLCPLWHPEREINQRAFVASEWNLPTPGRPLAEMIKCRYDAKRWNEALNKPTTSATSTESSESALVAIYQSFGKTNLGGAAFPTGCTFRAFAPDREDGKSKSLPVYEIQVTNIALRSTVVGRLLEMRFEGVAVVDDYRGVQHPLRYNVTNSAPFGLP